MPGFNRRGPVGQGPMTGRRMGRCTNYGSNLSVNTETDKELASNDMPEFSNRFGFGFGFGRGRRGRGLGHPNRFQGGF